MMHRMAVPARKSRSTNPLPPSVTGQRSEHRHTWRIAILTTGAAIVAGLIAAGSSYLTAQVQANSQAREARDDFLRSQRQAVYSTFLTDEKRFYDTENNYCGGPAPNRAQGSPPSKGVAQSEELSQLVGRINRDIQAIYVVGTPESADRAAELGSDDFAAFLYCRRNLTLSSDRTDSEGNAKKQIEAWNAAVKHRSLLLKQFKTDIASE
jgi:hypothetical protein